MHVIIVYPTYGPLVKRKLQYLVFTMCVGVLYKMRVLKPLRRKPHRVKTLNGPFVCFFVNDIFK